MDFSLSTTSATGGDSELARVQHETALAVYGEKGGGTDWKMRVTADTFFQETPELSKLVQPETGGAVPLREIFATGLLAMVLLLFVLLPDWSFWPRDGGEMPRAAVPLLLVDQMPVSTRQHAETFNKNCSASHWADAWKELTTLCTELPKNKGQEPRQELIERLYLLAMNRAGDLGESSWASVWLDLKKAKEALFPPSAVAPKLPDEVFVVYLRVAYLRDVKPVLDNGMDGSKSAPSLTRKELVTLGDEVRELQQRSKALSKDSQQRLDLVDAAIHLALVWTMTTANAGARVTVRRDPTPATDPETGRWWNRLHELIDTVEKDSSRAGQYEWKLIRQGFWLTLIDFTWKPYNENIHLGSHDYKESDVESKLKAAQ